MFTVQKVFTIGKYVRDSKKVNNFKKFIFLNNDDFLKKLRYSIYVHNVHFFLKFDHKFKIFSGIILRYSIYVHDVHGLKFFESQFFSCFSSFVHGLKIIREFQEMLRFQNCQGVSKFSRNDYCFQICSLYKKSKIQNLFTLLIKCPHVQKSDQNLKICSALKKC